MKTPFNAIIFFGIAIFLVACGLAATPTASPIPSSTAAVAASATPLPSVTPSPTITPTNQPAYISPTLIPTIDPTSLPQLLSEAFSLKVDHRVNGYPIKRLTGWDYGFRQKRCNGYQWLDSNHLLLYPRTGEEGTSYDREEWFFQGVVINLESEQLWLPWEGQSKLEWTGNCDSGYWSRELGIVIQQKTSSNLYSNIIEEAVFTYTFDGQETAQYWGKINGISPSGTKILVDDDTVIDLRKDEIIDLAWHMNYDLERTPRLFWSSDETRLYRCCFYFADLKTGKSHNFEWSDLRGKDGNPASFQILPHTNGEWVRNNNYFLVEWNWFNDYSADYIPMFSPVEKKYYDLSDMTGISASFVYYATFHTSPDGRYTLINGADPADGISRSFLVNLATFETTPYDIPIYDFEWSTDGRFGWADGLDSSNAYILSASSKKLLPFPVNPIGEFASWHPNEPVLAYLAENNQTLALLNAKNMKVETRILPISVGNFYWSPDGTRIAFLSAEGSLWQVEYPKFRNFEQLTEPLPGVRDVLWSPDGNSIAFISGADIYIVDTTK